MSEANRGPVMQEGRRNPGRRRWRAVPAGWLTALIGVGLMVLSLGALADGPDSAGYAHHGMWGGGWSGMFFGFFIMLLIIAAIAAAVVLVTRVLSGGGFGTAKPSGKSPTDILEERFARGEIDAAEFEERRRLLAKDST